MTEPNEPAYPGFSHVDGYGCSKPVLLPSGDWGWEHHFTGLTKREIFTMSAMRGLLPALATQYSWNWSDIADAAVKCADALIVSLNKE